MLTKEQRQCVESANCPCEDAATCKLPAFKIAEEGFRKFVLMKLDEIHDGKVGKVEPNYVMLTELSNAIGKSTKAILNTLYFDNEIKVGNTLNDKYIIRKSWKNE